MDRQSKIGYGMFAATLIGSISLIGFTLTASPILTYPSDLIVHGSPFKAGDTIHFDVERCATEDVTYTFTQQLVSEDNSYALPNGRSKVTEGCETIKSIPKVLPEIIEPGEYYLEFTVTHKGRLKEFSEDIRTSTFAIVE